MARPKKSRDSGNAFKNLLNQKEFSPYKLAKETGLGRDHISRIVNGEIASPKLETLEKIAEALKIDLTELGKVFTELPASAGLKQAENLELTLDPTFVGRDKAIADLNDLVNQNFKVILIHAQGGVGKTTLARMYLKQKFARFIEFPIAKETKDIASVESLIEEKLRQLDEEPGREFFISLERLKGKLLNEKIGVLIDNLEPALDENGKFIGQYRRYVELLRVLGDQSLQSVTLITSRESLHEESVTFRPYPLEGLSVEAWQEFFDRGNIQIHSPSLDAMHNAYAGNAKAMQILAGVIRAESASNLELYWQANQADQADLLSHKTLENLVDSQFNRLKKLDSNAYKLLCRLGCYRYQDVPTVRINGLLCLLWDVQESQRRRVVSSLRDRSLVEFKNGEYWLHPLIRAASIDRLRSSEEDWKKTNTQAAEFYRSDHQNIVGVNYAFEAIYHFYEIPDYENCYQFLIDDILGRKERLENLRCTPNLWNGVSRVIDIGEKLLENLSEKQKALILIPMGVLYTEAGQNNKAIEGSKQILHIVSQDDNCYELLFARLAANLIAGKAYRLMGNLTESEKACKKASEISHESKNYYWKALALYELASLYLEMGKPGRAIYCFVASAFRAIGSSKIPQEVYNLSASWFEQSADLSSRIGEIFNINNKNNNEEDRTKKFAILWNLSKSFYLMKRYNVSKILIDINKNIVKPTDKNSLCWIALELANYYSVKGIKDKVEEHYKEALKSSDNKGQAWCRAHTLRKYGDWKNENGEYSEALNIYNELDKLLQKTDFMELQANNYYRIGLISQQMGEIENSQVNFQNAIQLFNEIEAPKQVEKVQKAMNSGEYNQIDVK